MSMIKNLFYKFKVYLKFAYFSVKYDLKTDSKEILTQTAFESYTNKNTINIHNSEGNDQANSIRGQGEAKIEMAIIGNVQPIVCPLSGQPGATTCSSGVKHDARGGVGLNC